MEGRQRAGALKAQETFLEGRLMKREEEKYVEKVHTLLETAAPEGQFKRKQAQWYF